MLLSSRIRCLGKLNSERVESVKEVKFLLRFRLRCVHTGLRLEKLDHSDATIVLVLIKNPIEFKANQEYLFATNPKDYRNIDNGIEHNAHNHGPSYQVLSVSFSDIFGVSHHMPRDDQNAVFIEQINPLAEPGDKRLNASVVKARA